jgi:hypothetical protein
MKGRAALFLVLAMLAACGPTETPEARKRRLRGDTAAPVDTTFTGSVRDVVEIPETWDTIRNPNGLEFRQPQGFTFGLDAARLDRCDSITPGADVAIFDQTFLERWPLTLAVRRGDVNQIASTNGFTIDSTDVSTHGSSGDSTTMRSGEGWVLLSGRTARDVPVLFAAKRLPGGCHLIWAARGAELDPDTLSRVLSTVRFTP